MINRLRRSVKEFFREDFNHIASKPVINDEFNIDDLRSLDVIFLLTVGRSGTKSLIDYLNRNSELYAVHAPTPSLATLGSLVWRSEVDESCAQWAYFSSREKYLIDSYKRGISFVDGDCKNLPLLPTLANFFPNSKFVHVVREPSKFIMSGLNRGYYTEKNPVFWGHLCPKDRDIWARDFRDQVTLIAKFWEEGNSLARKVKDITGESRFVTLRAEDFFQNSGLINEAFYKIGCENFGKDDAPLPKLNKNKKTEDFDSDLINEVVKEYCSSAQKIYPQLFE